MAPDLPYWRLSGFYFFYFAAVGTLVPYAPVYLASLGFGATDIGVAMSMLVVSRIFGPNVWSWLCDRWKKPARIVQATTILAIPAFFWVVSTRSPTVIPLALLLFGFFWSASLPQMESATLNALGMRTELYSRIRVWGSIGFIVAAAAIGRVIQVNGVSVFPGAMLALLACLALVILLQRESVYKPTTAAREPLTDVLTDRRVVALFAACLLIHVGHGPYYTFFPSIWAISGIAPLPSGTCGRSA
jgi:PPP family 3-phenylpropionic acid transporter